MLCKCVFDCCILPFYLIDLDRTIKIYNVSETSYELSATLQGHHGAVFQLSWAHPKFGVLLASCSFDGSVIVHREQRPGSWNVVYHASGLHNSSVNGVAFAPQEYGLMLATASSDGRVAILKHLPNQTWSIEYLSDCPTGVNAVSWAPYGSYVNMSTGMEPTSAEQQQQQSVVEPEIERFPRIVTAGCDSCIRIYVCDGNGQWTLEFTSPVGNSTTTTGTNTGTLSLSSSASVVGHTDWVRDVAWAPCLLPNHNTIATCSEDRTVIIWNQPPPPSTTTSTTADGNPSMTLSSSLSEWTGTVMHTFEHPVWRVSWSITGHLLAVSSGDSNVTLWKASLQDRNHWTQVQTSTDPLTESQ
jgi:protein transport protein SEC13